MTVRGGPPGGQGPPPADEPRPDEVSAEDAPVVDPAVEEQAAPEDARRARQATIRAFRPRRVVPATIVAALLALGSILVAAEIVSRLVDRPLNILPADRLAELGRETQWSDALTTSVAIVAILLGLFLLLAGLRPGRVRAVPLAPERPDAVMAVTRGGLAHIVAHAAESVDGVTRARATVTPGRIRVQADSWLRDPGELTDQVHRVVNERIDHMSLLQPFPVRVTVRRREEG